MINIEANIILVFAFQEKSVKVISWCQQVNNNQKRRLTDQSKSDDNETTYELVKIDHEKCQKILNFFNESSYLNIDSMSYHTDLSH